MGEGAAAVPCDEVEHYVQTISDAFDAASHGGVIRGRMLLEDGLRHAEEASEEGEDWAGEMVDVWNEALAEFLCRYPS